MREQYGIENFQMPNAAEYINKIKFNVDVSQIYQICDSCNYNMENAFCPIILKLGPQMKTINSDSEFKTNLKEYLLQVWDREGRMLYER